MAERTIRAGAADLGLAIGFDKHPRGAFNADPESMGLGAWYGETGMMLTTQFFALKIQRYMHDHGITPSTLAKVAVKAFENGAENPNAWRRTPMTEEQVAGLDDGVGPAHPVHVLLAGRGRRRPGAVPRRQGPPVHRHAGLPRRRRRSRPAATARSRCSARRWRPSGPTARPSTPPGPRFEQAGIGPGDVDVAQIQDTESGAEVMHMAETGLCKDGEQEQLIQSGATEIGGSMPINTDGGCIANGEPIGASGLRQVHENVLQLQRRRRRPPGARRAEGRRSPTCTAPPGVSACTVMTR